MLALLNRPRLVILDELTQGLDPAARRDVWAAVGQLRDEGTTVLLVTHELDEAEALCDRVVAMRDGRVLDQGPPADLVDRHAGWATVRFGWPRVRRPAGRSAAALPGVRDVDATVGGSAFTATGAVIAHVGAELVRARTRSRRRPAVDVPDLEAALLGLLAAPVTTETEPHHDDDRHRASRPQADDRAVGRLGRDASS